MDDYNMYVPNVHYEIIPIKNLVSNQEYQRVLSSNQEKRLQPILMYIRSIQLKSVGEMESTMFLTVSTQ